MNNMKDLIDKLELSNDIRQCFILSSNVRVLDEMLNQLLVYKSIGLINNKNLEEYKYYTFIRFNMDTRNIKSFEELEKILINIRNSYISSINNIISKEVDKTKKKVLEKLLETR